MDEQEGRQAMSKRDKDGRPYDSGEYISELLAAGLAGMSWEEFDAYRKRQAAEDSCARAWEENNGVS